MKRGHVTGTKVETHGASAWYAAIEEANIRAVEDAERALVTALAQQVGNAVSAMPEAASRIAKAASLVQHTQVWPLRSGNCLVGSQSDREAAHLVKRCPWHCDCPDHTHRGVTCKHIFAVQLTIKVGQAYQANYSMPAAAYPTPWGPRGPRRQQGDIPMPRTILPRNEGEQTDRFDGTSVVPLDNESGTYREWLIRVDDTPYCIVNEGDTWTLLSCVPGVGWCDAPDTVDTFLATHKLRLGN